MMSEDFAAPKTISLKEALAFMIGEKKPETKGADIDEKAIILWTAKAAHMHKKRRR